MTPLRRYLYDSRFLPCTKIILHVKTIAMKRVFVFCLPALFLLSCKQSEKEGPMSGVYRMTTQAFQNETMDTTLTTGQQLKIFTGTYLMYARFNPADSASSFGIGTYTMSGDTIIEHISFTASDTTRNYTPRTYRLLIEHIPGGYKQIIPQIEDANGAIMKLTETYDSVGTDATCPLDGVWAMQRQYYLEGGDTVWVPGTQFKVYHKGYFIWGRSYADSNNTLRTGMGYGKYTPKEDGVLQETVLSSTFPDIRTQDFVIDYVVTNEDEYQQTLTNSDGVRVTEMYKRMKQ